MPYKNKKKEKRYKEQRYMDLQATAITQSHKNYQSNRDAVCLGKKNLYASSKTVRKNKQAYARDNTSARLQSDCQYYQNNLARARVNTAKRLTENADYYKKNLETARVNTVKRLKENDEYKSVNRKRAYVNKKKRLLDANYAMQYKQRLNEQQRTRFQTDSTYAESKRFAAKHRKHPVSRQLANHGLATHVAGGRVQKPSKQQTYWRRRRRLLASLSGQQRMLSLHRKMQLKSHTSLLDVRLLFAKAVNTLNKAQAKLQRLDASLKEKAKLYNECLTAGVPHHNVDKVFSCIHSCSSEPYFLETAYNVLSASTEPVAIDEQGRAHVFKPVYVDASHCKK